MQGILQLSTPLDLEITPKKPLERILIHLISDLHLSPDRPELLSQFDAFADTLAAGDDLYILGDLFEYWLGDDAVEFLGHGAVERLLISLSARGTKIFFLSGNRDFLLGQPFADRCGIQLIADEHVIQVGSRRVLLMHGDSLCTDDLPHQAFRKLVRSADWQRAFLDKSVVERDGLAKLARYRSEDGKAQKTTEIMDVNQQAVEQVMHSHGVDTLIHGHTHRPAIHRFESPQAAHRIVLGDWTPEPSWIQLSSAGVQLAFSGSQQRLDF
jgi:UDP-2,3-diacylglucosamine hydrolase